MHLYLVQHGAAEAETVDPDRHLSESGIQDVKRLADFLRSRRLSVAAIWHSGKPRAHQTAGLLSHAISARRGVVQRSDLAPKDPVAPLRETIEQMQDDLMIVGHLPLLSRLASSLLANNEEVELVGFQYGSVVCLERLSGGGWKLGWMMVPGLLSEVELHAAATV